MATKNGVDKKKWAFSNFTTQKKFVSAFGVMVELSALTPRDDLPGCAPTPFLIEAISRAIELSLTTEKIVSEALVFPVLIEVLRAYRERITLFSGEKWAVEDETTPLNGVCDFLIGGRPGMSAPESPVICVVEAKKQDFDVGTFQCGAELFACKLENERNNKAYPFYFGCVTTGVAWVFIKLDCENNVLIRDKYSYTLENLPRLLGAWKWVLETQLAAAPKKDA